MIFVPFYRRAAQQKEQEAAESQEQER